MTVDIKDPTRRATMYALRATGRYVARVAKSKAPVYRGNSDPRAMAEKGNLRRSIANARRLSSTDDAFELKVGPFGTKKKGTGIVRYGKVQGGGALAAINAAKNGRTFSRKNGESTAGEVRGVPMYRSKMEAKYGFMVAAVSAAEADGAKAIFEEAYAKAWAKWSA
jgi:hypothetical protein